MIEHDQMRGDGRDSLPERLIDRPLGSGWLGHRPEQHDTARRRNLGQHVERGVHRFQRRFEIVAEHRHPIGKQHGIHAAWRRRKVAQPRQRAIQRVAFKVRDPIAARMA